MSRPLCPRRIGHRPPADYFKPAGIPMRDLYEIELAADEVEALRLADHQGLYREECAAEMEISRQTFDRIVRRARAKVAEALAGGHALRLLRPAADTTVRDAASERASAAPSNPKCGGKGKRR